MSIFPWNHPLRLLLTLGFDLNLLDIPSVEQKLCKVYLIGILPVPC